MMKTLNTYQKCAFETAKYFVLKPDGSLRPCANKQIANAVVNEFGGEIVSIKQAKERGIIN